MRLNFYFLAMACMATMSASAQNFSYIAGSDIPGPDTDAALHGERLLVWFDTDFHHSDKVDGQYISSIFNGKTDMISSSANIETNAAKLHGCELTATVENGMFTVTVPSTVNCPSEDNPVTAGTVLFRLILGGAPNRIGDTDNTWGPAYLGGEKPCTGAYIGLRAPKGATVTGIFTTPGVDTADGYGNIIRGAYSDCGECPSNDYVELTGKPLENDLAVVNYCTTKFLNGYCCKYVEVAVGNVKPGDKVQLRGIQSLYEGYTPVAMTPSDLTGIGNVLTEGVQGAAEYYTLQGVKVNGKPNQGLYIRVQDGKAVKELVK